MASNYTENYGLCQWEAMDNVLRTDFNEDNTKIDAALKAMADNNTALEGTLVGHAAAIAKCGSCQIHHFTYVGTGGFDVQSPTRITFSRLPVLFFVMGREMCCYGSRYSSTILVDISNNNQCADAAWSGNTVSFSRGRADFQLNTQGETYHVFAFYDLQK